MPVGIGDFCIQDGEIAKITKDRDHDNLAYDGNNRLIDWFIHRSHHTPLNVSEFLFCVNNKYFTWPKNNTEEIKFLKEAWLYAIKNSYGIDLSK